MARPKKNEKSTVSNETIHIVPEGMPNLIDEKLAISAISERLVRRVLKKTKKTYEVNEDGQEVLTKIEITEEEREPDGNILMKFLNDHTRPEDIDIATEIRDDLRKLTEGV